MNEGGAVMLRRKCAEYPDGRLTQKWKTNLRKAVTIEGKEKKVLSETLNTF